MKFEFDSNNATELRAVEAAVAVLLEHHNIAEALRIHADIQKGAARYEQNLKADPLVAAVTEAQDKLESAQPPTANPFFEDAPSPLGEALTGDILVPSPPAEDLDSAGQPWNPELHSSSRAKVADGTWKKKRAARSVETLAKESGLTQDEVAARLAEPLPLATSNGDFKPEQVPPVPPVPTPVTPPAPPMPVPAAGGPSAEQKIWALYTGQVVTINRVLEVARAHGYADLGALRQADEAAKAEVLKVLEGE